MRESRLSVVGPADPAAVVPRPPSAEARRASVELRSWWLLASLLALAAFLVDPLRSLVREGPGRWLHIFVVSGMAAFCLTPFSRALAFRIGAVDLPERRKVHDSPTPRLGGLAVYTAIALALSLNGIPDTRLTLLLISAGGLLIVGAADDLGGVSARIRLGVQVLVSLVVAQGGVVLELFPVGTHWGGAGNLLLTVVWLVGITNAFNFFDGMDGLASGLAVVMAGFLGGIAFLTGQPHLGWASIAIVGACVGFLPHNFRIRGAARAFLGDGGSTVLGFLLAGLAVHGEWAVGHPLINLSAPLLIFGVLIFDLIHTTVARVVRGDVRTLRQWIEYTDRDHLHHRFEALLRSKRKAVLLILLLAVALGLTAILIRSVSIEGSILLLLQSTTILIVVTILEHAGNLRERRTIRSNDPPA